MNKSVIVEKLSKKYLISHEMTPHYYTFREMIMLKLRQTVGLEPREPLEEFWALKGISFEAGEGEIVGVTGPNGSGKSTLLKIIARVTEPTEGRVVLFGRLTALLEAGAGFHPELTGRENIFLNSALVGMKRKEVKRRFDNIVNFAEVEKFVDTPVKRYSTGMFVRLGFSIAVNVEPDIFLVDEILSICDASFQEKAFNKIRELAKKGATVLLVSHNEEIINKLCTRKIKLDKGVIKASTAQ